MTSAPQADETLVIVRRTEQKQETDYVTGGGFSAKSHEDALDRLTLMVQDLEEKINRALKLAETTPTTAAPTLPEPEAREHLRWNEVGSDLENVKVADLGSLSISAATDNRLIKTDGGDGDIQETAISVDDNDNVTGINALTVGGTFNSRGIDDNGTQEVIQLDNNTIAFTTTSGAFTLRNITTSDFLAVTGSNSGSNGGQIRLYGHEHPSQANDIELRSGTIVRARWDDSEIRWDFNGNELFEVSNVLRGINDGSMFISGGSATGLGGNIILRGEAQTGEANDILFRSGTTLRARWDNSNARWDFNGFGLYQVTAVTRGIDNSTLFIGAGSASTLGSNLVLYGDTEGSTPNDIRLRVGAVTQLHYDHSESEWNFQNIGVTGVNRLVLQGTRKIHTNDANNFVVISGGNDAPNGGNVLLYGGSHASLANDIYLRSGSVSKMFWDDSAGSWSLNNNPLVGIPRMSMNIGPEILADSGSPESTVAAPVGSIYMRVDGGAGSSFYVKESGVGNTGWVAK